MKSYEDIREYKRMYYLANRKKLCEYSNNYYKYKKCNGDFTDEQIDSQLKLFLTKYKKHSPSTKTVIQIKKLPVTISFN